MSFTRWGGLALLSLAIPALAGQTTSSESYQQQAQRLAGADLEHLYKNFCKVGDKADLSALEIPATRVFDNLVFLGRGKWNSWALLTSDGIILFDAMETETEAQRYIVEGLQSLGLDPASIKKVVVMHGHGDHSGGARLLQSRYGAEVYLSQADWDLLELTKKVTLASNDDSTFAFVDGVKVRKLFGDQTVPDFDKVVTDGMTLTLGDAQVQLFLTPGHTDGTVSAILPVQHKGQTYYAGYWGGTGFTHAGAKLSQYQQSIARFQQASKEAGVSVAMSNHPTSDMTLVRLPLLEQASGSAEHPFVIGVDGYQRLLGTLSLCIKAYQNKKE